MDCRKNVLEIAAPAAEIPGINGLKIGKVVQVDARGEVFVSFGRGDHGYIACRITSSAKDKLLQDSPVGCEVLLGFEEDDPLRPIILDTLASSLEKTVLGPAPAPGVDERQPKIFLEAEDEVTLQCGEASITLTKTGKVVIRGTYLLSRSSGANSIKGSSIRIN